MKRYTRVLASLIPIFGIALSVGSAYALTFQQDVGVSFTFNSTLSVTLSSSDILIKELIPGTASDSDVITINIKTNSTNGYTLNATVGDENTYDTRDLVHSDSNISNKFASIDFGSSISALTGLDNNTWAYSYSLDNGSSWVNYDGLPLYSDTENVSTIKNSTGASNSTDGDNVKFKIGAKASSDQASGEYNNVINFAVVATPVPVTLSQAYADAGKEKLNGYYKLQDMTSEICDAADVIDEGSQMQAIDIRDNKVYWITKLQDGKCWFTQNLDLDIDENVTYTHDDTDLGYGTSTTQSWTPNKSTHSTEDKAWIDSRNQQSYDPGDKIWDGVGDADDKYGHTHLDNMSQGTNPHFHLGNYYNFGAAIAVNDPTDIIAGIDNNNQGADQSICPAGWTLPLSYTSVDGAGSFESILDNYYDYEWWDMGTILGPPLYYSLSGIWDGGSDVLANRGYYRSLDLTLFTMDTGDDFPAVGVSGSKYGSWGSERMEPPNVGFSVRCVSR